MSAPNKIVTAALFLTFSLSVYATCIVPQEWSFNPIVVEGGTQPYTFSVKSHHDGKILGEIWYEEDPEATFMPYLTWFDNRGEVIAKGSLFIREDWGFSIMLIGDCKKDMLSSPRAKRINNGSVEELHYDIDRGSMDRGFINLNINFHFSSATERVSEHIVENWVTLIRDKGLDPRELVMLMALGEIFSSKGP